MGDNNSVEKAKEIQELKTEYKGLEKRVTKVEVATEKNERNIGNMQLTQAELKTSINNLVEKVTHLETRLFDYLDDLRQDGTKKDENWQETIITIIKLTVAALIGYLFANGGM